MVVTHSLTHSLTYLFTYLLPKSGTYHCHVTSEPKPVRLYGNEYIFPRTFDVAQSKDSVCTSDDQCTGITHSLTHSDFSH